MDERAPSTQQRVLSKTVITMADIVATFLCNTKQPLATLLHRLKSCQRAVSVREVNSRLDVCWRGQENSSLRKETIAA